MSDSTQPPRPQRTSARVRDRDAADQILRDLAAQGVPPDRCTTRPVAAATGGGPSPRATGEQDIGFTESAGKTMGAGWLVGALIGVIVGTIGVSLLFEPPWESGLAAGITLAVAIGVAYIAGGLGFLQAGIARTGETGGEPLTRQDPGHAEQGQDVAAERSPGAAIEVVVETDSAEELERAHVVFAAHEADQID